MLAAAVGADRERLLTVERDRSDGALAGFRVEFDAAVAVDAAETLPTAQRIADRLRQLALWMIASRRARSHGSSAASKSLLCA